LICRSQDSMAEISLDYGYLEATELSHDYCFKVPYIDTHRIEPVSSPPVYSPLSPGTGLGTHFVQTSCQHRAVGNLTPAAIGYHPMVRNRSAESSVSKDQDMRGELLTR